MKVRKTLIFSLENRQANDLPKGLSRHSLLYRAAGWLESTMRALQAHRDAEVSATETSALSKESFFNTIQKFPFQRYLFKSRQFMPVRGRLPVCAHLKRPGPYHW